MLYDIAQAGGEYTELEEELSYFDKWVEEVQLF